MLAPNHWKKIADLAICTIMTNDIIMTNLLNWIIRLTGEVTRESINELMDEILKGANLIGEKLDEKEENVKGELVVEINSGGGDVDEAIRFVEWLQRMMKTYPRVCFKSVITSQCASSAVMIALAFPYRDMYRHATVLIHALTVHGSYSSDALGRVANSLAQSTKVYMHIMYRVLGPLCLAQRMNTVLGLTPDDPTWIRRDEFILFDEHIFDYAGWMTLGGVNDPED